MACHFQIVSLSPFTGTTPRFCKFILLFGWFAFFHQFITFPATSLSLSRICSLILSFPFLPQPSLPICHPFLQTWEKLPKLQISAGGGKNKAKFTLCVDLCLFHARADSSFFQGWDNLLLGIL